MFLSPDEFDMVEQQWKLYSVQRISLRSVENAACRHTSHYIHGTRGGIYN